MPHLPKAALLLAMAATVPAQTNPPVHFTDIRPTTGITFQQDSTQTDEKYYLETMGTGVAAIDYDQTNYEVINLGESRTVELRELIALIKTELGTQAAIDWQPLQPGDVPQTFADISKARRLLNYSPQTQIEMGIKQFIEWFKSQR